MLQICPRCQIPVAETGCPRCGRQPDEEGTSPPSDQPQADSQPPIQFDVMVTSEPAPKRNQLDWKEELKKKLEQRMEDSRSDVVETGERPTDPAPEEEIVETPPTLFKYKLDRALRSSSPPSKVEKRSTPAKAQHVFAEPLIRRKPIRPVQQPPGQKTLRLKHSAPTVKEVEANTEDQVIEEDKLRIPKEILFSRFLSGIVDLVLPLLMGLAFTIVASFILGFDLLSPASMKWIGLLALSFFFFNSLFFFLTSGQTPGMLVTDLRLVGEDEREVISTSSILLRVLFFLPSALTVVGLAWAIFDPLCRCFHDLVSRTRIEPAS